MSDAVVGVTDQSGQANARDIATRAITQMAQDGSMVTAYLQLVIPADGGGKPVDLAGIVPLLSEIRHLLVEIHGILERNV
jgi:hypothetical protein